MAKKPTLSTIASGYASNTTLNSNFEELRDAFDNTLSLDGSTPNAMGADLDLNGNNIIGASGLTVNGTDYLAEVTAAKAAALVAQAAAETAETNAETAETNASSSQTAAASSASAASSSATAAQTAETAAELAETNAETAAALSTTNGAAQVVLATAQVALASTEATNAATSATTATTQASTATTQAGIATTKASEASASASAAAASAASITDEEANAAASASAAASSATASANSAAASAAALDTFDDRYLGSKTANPTLDNDGDALVAGALYFNSTANEMRVYDGANWIAASSSGVASMNLYEYTATSGQTTFTGSDDNSNSISFIAGNEIVVLNGVILDPSDYNSSSGTSIVLATGAATGDLLNVYAFKSFTVADTVSASAGGTFAGNITVTGSFTSQGIDDNANATAITIDASENVGIGVVPTTDHNPVVEALQIGSTANLYARSDAETTVLSSNSYLSTAGWPKYITTNEASEYNQSGGIHRWYNAPSGTAGAACTLTERMRIDSSGNVGIGISDPSGVRVYTSASGSGDVTVTRDQGTDGSDYHYLDTVISPTENLVKFKSTGASNGGFTFNNSSSEYMRINSSGNLLFNGSGVVSVQSASSNMYIGGGTYQPSMAWIESGSLTGFKVNGAERMRIDSSGNLLVGQTTANSFNLTSGFGFDVRQTYGLGVAVQDNPTAIFNRTNTDGDIAVFRKDGSTVGSIGTWGGGFYVGSPSAADAYLYFGNAYVAPSTTSGFRDNAIDLGNGSARFDDVYATNGSIQTSDRNEKQDIASLTATEMLVAARISGLFKTFRWIDSVADKGDNARTHTGVIAQDVQAAFIAEGLDAGDYALFTSATWWETQTDVAAVEADEDNDIEASDAHTRTDTYDTLDEAPDGATERTRMGIRYPELLAFVGAYNEQRFASIETRLAALEAV